MSTPYLRPEIAGLNPEYLREIREQIAREQATFAPTAATAGTAGRMASYPSTCLAMTIR